MTIPKVEVKKILYATDLSENARQAFAYAVSLAGLYKAGLTILHVIAEDPDLDKRVAGWIDEKKWNEIKAQNVDEARQALIGKQREGIAIRNALNAFCEEAQVEAGDCRFETDDVLVERGHPAESILKLAAEKSVDLIVMGSHGYSGFKDALMGGTARKVLRHAKVPVLLVRIPED
jgi:nucleotide-binding universal stress UspA family protein